MINIPKELLTQFEQLLNKKKILEKEHSYYKKWLRYYLDFCHKYNYPQLERESLPHFLKKLQEKKQTKDQQKQASYAVSLYYELVKSNEQRSTTVKDNQKSPKKETSSEQEETKSAKDKWGSVYTNLNNEIKMRHYSPKTLKAYTLWIKKFQYLLKVKT